MIVAVLFVTFNTPNGKKQDRFKMEIAIHAKKYFYIRISLKNAINFLFILVNNGETYLQIFFN